MKQFICLLIHCLSFYTSTRVPQWNRQHIYRFRIGGFITSTRVPQWNGQHDYCFIIRALCTSRRVPQWNRQHIYCFIIRVFIRLVLPHLPFQHQVFLYVHKSPTMKQLIYLCQEMSTDVKIWQKMSRRYDKIYQHMSRYVNIPHDISKYDIYHKYIKNVINNYDK